MRETKELQRAHQDQMPTRAEPTQPKSDQPQWEDAHGNTDTRCTAPQLNSKGETSTAPQKALTPETTEDKHPQEARTQVHTDWSATYAVNNGGAGVFVRSSDGTTLSEAIPTGMNCTNYRAEVEALVHATRILSDAIDEQGQVVFLTDARSVLEATTAGKLPHLQKTP
jgi:hypothetical protein